MLKSKNLIASLLVVICGIMITSCAMGPKCGGGGGRGLSKSSSRR